MADIKPKLRVDVNHNPTKKGVKVQFVLPKTLEGDAKAQATQKLQAKLNQGLEQYNLTVSQDTDVPYSNVIGFLIPIADIKLLIKNAISGGSSEPAPEEMPAEEPMKEVERMQELAGIGSRTPKKNDLVLYKNDEWIITKVTEKEVSLTKLSQLTTHNIPVEEFLKDYKWDDEIERWKK